MYVSTWPHPSPRSTRACFLLNAYLGMHFSVNKKESMTVVTVIIPTNLSDSRLSDHEASCLITNDWPIIKSVYNKGPPELLSYNEQCILD